MPDPFKFPDHLGVAPGSAIVTETITLSGLSGPPAVTASGGQVSITGQPYTTNGTASNGDTLTLQITAPAGAGQSATCTVTMGGYSDVIKITTAGSAPAAPSAGGSGGGGQLGLSEIFIVAAFTFFIRRKRNKHLRSPAQGAIGA